ncbi:MAG: septum formation initiator family protein [Aquificae bacterium]|nr:septum formation initiator family protein [Aquificota bacterium]
MDLVLLIFLFLFAVYFAYVLLFGEKNVFKLIKRENYRKTLQYEVSRLDMENKRLEQMINYLKKDMFFIEKKAREDLGLVKEGEEIYIIIDGDRIVPKKEKRWIDEVIKKYQEFQLK